MGGNYSGHICSLVNDLDVITALYYFRWSLAFHTVVLPVSLSLAGKNVSRLAFVNNYHHDIPNSLDIVPVDFPHAGNCPWAMFWRWPMSVSTI